ncbi:MAG: hypothetical protein P1V51_24200 [Deltaproteobacteria bacterium]|nr:hypothetical protein [Deltaproteobacteria bacterium]
MRRLLLLLALLTCVPAAHATTGDAKMALLGLRPTTDASRAETDVLELGQAQRLRDTASSVLEAVSGTHMLDHETITQLLGRSYLVDLFACGESSACVEKLSRPLMKHGVHTVIVGDYYQVKAGYRMRIRVIDLETRRERATVELDLPLKDATSLPVWRESLATLFDDTGSLRIVTNVEGYACTLDGAPCDFLEPGLIAGVKEGEHLLVLTRAGHKSATQGVSVKRGVEQRVVLPLEAQPMKVQRAPDPKMPLPAFPEPSEEVEVIPFGYVRLLLVADDHNSGDLEDFVVDADPSRERELTLTGLPMPALLGVGLQSPQLDSGWVLRGGVAAGFIKTSVPELDSAYAEAEQEDWGTRVVLGLAGSIVNSLAAGTQTLPEGFGDLAPTMVGVQLTQTLGPMVIEAFGGRFRSQFTEDGEWSSGSASPAPTFALRLAYLDEDRVGSLYGEEQPLTLSISGAFTLLRVGVGEEEWVDATFVGATRPVIEDLPTWLLSAELFVPFGQRGSLAGEFYLGDGAHLFEGALLQGHRFDPTTGLHWQLRAAGGWLQVIWAFTDTLELRLTGGQEQIVNGLQLGFDPAEGTPIHWNRLVALGAVWRPFDNLSVGLQLHRIDTKYDRGPRTDLHGVALATQLSF